MNTILKRKIIILKTAVTKTFNWEASHQLPNHEGKCSRPHGHSYKAEVTYEGPAVSGGPSKGMVIDFYDIHKVWDPIEEEVLDHYNLNETLPDEYHPTTAENIARYIFDRMSEPDFGMTELVEVSVWETATGKATVKR